MIVNLRPPFDEMLDPEDADQRALREAWLIARQDAIDAASRLEKAREVYNTDCWDRQRRERERLEADTP